MRPAAAPIVPWGENDELAPASECSSPRCKLSRKDSDEGAKESGELKTAAGPRWTKYHRGRGQAEASTALAQPSRRSSQYDVYGNRREADGFSFKDRFITRMIVARKNVHQLGRNEKYALVEAPIDRKVRTASIAAQCLQLKVGKQQAPATAPAPHEEASPGAGSSPC